jgi:hypothetical protein
MKELKLELVAKAGQDWLPGNSEVVPEHPSAQESPINNQKIKDISVPWDTCPIKIR